MHWCQITNVILDVCFLNGEKAIVFLRSFKTEGQHVLQHIVNYDQNIWLRVLVTHFTKIRYLGQNLVTVKILKFFEELKTVRA